MISSSNRGKKVEGLLDREFKKLDISLPNSTMNVYDARSSRGAMSNPRPGDFCLYLESRWL